MNVLPLVFAFLLILSFSAHSLLQRRIDTKIEELGYSGAMNAIRLAGDEEVKLRNEVLNNIESAKAPKTGKTAKPRDAKVEKDDEPERRTKNFESKRLKPSIVDCAGAKFNLSPLFEKGALSFYDAYYEIAARLINRLYGHASFFTPDLEYQVLDLIIKQGKANPPALFTDLHQDQGGLSDLLYKMIIGTQEYDLAKGMGYPPLAHFFYFDASKQKKPLYFYFASKILLDAALGEEAADAVMAEEKKLWEKKEPRYILKHEEFTALMSQKYPTKVSKEVIELFNFGTHGPKESKMIQGKDEKTKIVHKRKAVSMQPEQKLPSEVPEGEVQPKR